MILTVHHIAIIVKSEKSLLFYKKLGFSESFRKIRNYDTIVLMDGYDIRLEIFIDPRHPSQSNGINEPIGIRHFALKVDDIEKTINELDLDEKNIGQINTDWTGIRFCFIKDPDGLTVELHE